MKNTLSWRNYGDIAKNYLDRIQNVGQLCEV